MANLIIFIQNIPFLWAWCDCCQLLCKFIFFSLPYIRDFDYTVSISYMNRTFMVIWRRCGSRNLSWKRRSWWEREGGGYSAAQVKYFWEHVHFLGKSRKNWLFLLFFAYHVDLWGGGSIALHPFPLDPPMVWPQCSSCLKKR